MISDKRLEHLDALLSDCGKNFCEVWFKYDDEEFEFYVTDGYGGTWLYIEGKLTNYKSYHDLVSFLYTKADDADLASLLGEHIIFSNTAEGRKRGWPDAETLVNLYNNAKLTVDAIVDCLDDELCKTEEKGN